MNKNKVFVKVKLYDVLYSQAADAWKNMCEKYGINQWCISEGWADKYSEVEITLEDAALYGLVDMD